MADIALLCILGEGSLRCGPLLSSQLKVLLLSSKWKHNKARVEDSKRNLEVLQWITGWPTATAPTATSHRLSAHCPVTPPVSQLIPHFSGGGGGGANRAAYHRCSSSEEGTREGILTDYVQLEAPVGGRWMRVLFRLWLGALPVELRGESRSGHCRGRTNPGTLYWKCIYVTVR